jgi:hypothetical protein
MVLQYVLHVNSERLSQQIRDIVTIFAGLATKCPAKRGALSRRVQFGSSSDQRFGVAHPAAVCSAMQRGAKIPRFDIWVGTIL